MTSTHIDRCAELGSRIMRLKANIRGETNNNVQRVILAQLQDVVRERNDLLDAIDFRVPELQDGVGGAQW